MHARNLRNRFLGAFGFAAIALVVFAVACDDHDGHRDRGGQGAGEGEMGCSQFTSCSTCTPVTGCGWCATATGQGLCASDPDECASASAFSWTWDPGGCLVPVDASAVTVQPADGGLITEPIDAGGTPTDGAITTPIEASSEASVDAGDASGGS
jgi:hypothetical protein